MNKYESKLLAHWPQHHSHGMVVFILWRAVVFFVIPFAGTFWIFHLFVFHHHTAHWEEIVYSVGVGLLVGVIRGVSLWRKMERLYENSQKQKEHLA